MSRAGSWALLIEAEDVVPVLERLREALSLEPPALMALKRELPGPVFRGSTAAEAELIRQLLGDLAEVVVVPDAERAVLRLRFFFDAGAGTCLWAASDAARERYGYAVDAVALPIAAELAERLAAITAEYDSSIDWQDPGSPGPWSEVQRVDFEVRSRDLLSELRAALGASYEIV